MGGNARVVAEGGRAVGWGHTGWPPPAEVVREVGFCAFFVDWSGGDWDFFAKFVLDFCAL